MASNIVNHLRNTYDTGLTKPIAWRRAQLEALLRMLDENKERICNALWEDLHKNRIEAELMEFAQVRNATVLMLENLEELALDKKCKRSIVSFLNDVRIIKEAYGVVLIISPWNYPFVLLLQPFIGAIAAGNCVVLKPSEISQATGQLMKNLIPQYLNNDCYSVVVGGPKESNDLLTQNRFDLIMYTGGPYVGKIVMKEAAKHLTPVILELGGKNPCYIHSSCDLEATARCVAWGKWTNAGQICISPDYILCEEKMSSPLISALKRYIKDFYGENPQDSPDFGRIISQRHLKRLVSLLKGVQVVYGGVIDEEERYLSPTIVTNVSRKEPIFHEEIFGPILPIITVESVDEAIQFINSGEKALGLSIFAKNRSVIEKVVNETSSGGVTVNDLLMQFNELDLPFGGVGNSGMGYCHGEYSYNSFCHKKSYYESRTPDSLVQVRYPPYSLKKVTMLKSLLFKRRKMLSISIESKRILLAALLGLALAYFVYITK